ncbi:OmpA family protein [Sulfitobacter guttiformis]|uniref:OOP family OmpA-OmpF porin n=1 Tax=Sulfitobacter guttiformis TaxID=74349 RepID=A0A420DRC0_9RHOB|nr:OmpA family protein [Sulfitobacter guttiformis]KIN74111.1 OmpA family domain protein [Sulfitobacter guttiformis KCTC 32187]RKE96728.1 OOP family OmpA-OmpF porin [Sulfitobacter guttiformis]
MRAWLGALLISIAGTVQAVELQLPTGARQMITRDTAQDRFLVPVGPFADDVLPTQVIEGTVARSAWRIDVAGLTPLQLAAPLRDQLVEAGYRIVLDCDAQVCGGYDFRFAAEVLPAPNMYVNIRNFHVLSALRGPGGAVQEAVTILASASSGASFIQIIQAGTATGAVVAAGNVAMPAQTEVAASLSQQLVQNGRVVLGGLEFESGTSDLGRGPFDVLEELAAQMTAQQDMRVALVGHTDNVGSQDVNAALSVSRADAVRRYLIERHGVAAARLEVQGAGYIAPLATNLTAQGREANRRVEAVMLSN